MSEKKQQSVQKQIDQFNKTVEQIKHENSKTLVIRIDG